MKLRSITAVPKLNGLSLSAQRQQSIIMCSDELYKGVARLLVSKKDAPKWLQQ